MQYILVNIYHKIHKINLKFLIFDIKYDSINKDYFDNLLENNMPIFKIVLYNLFLVKNNLARKIIYTNKYQKKYNEVFLFEMKLTQEDKDKLCYDFAFSKNLNYNEKYYLSVHNDR